VQKRPPMRVRAIQTTTHSEVCRGRALSNTENNEVGSKRTRLLRQCATGNELGGRKLNRFGANLVNYMISAPRLFLISEVFPVSPILK
jgi:hypothetical protein